MKKKEIVSHDQEEIGRRVWFHWEDGQVGRKGVGRLFIQTHFEFQVDFDFIPFLKIHCNFLWVGLAKEQEWFLQEKVDDLYFSFIVFNTNLCGAWHIFRWQKFRDE